MIAYFILVHRYPGQFKRLFRAIFHPANYYLVHVDKRSGLGLQTEIQDFLSSFANNASLLKSQSILWGGYSMVDAELRGIEELLKISSEWEFFINLSAQDFPLKSQTHIQDFLSRNIGKDFIKVANQRKIRPDTLSRIENYCIEFSKRILRTPIKRPYLRGVTPYIGNQWMILSRKFCEYMCYSPEVKRFKRFYRHTFIPDEGFFQTVIMNTNYEATIVNDDKRTIVWVPAGTIKLRPRDFTSKDSEFLLASQGLFARKFDGTVDAGILSILESNLRSSRSGARGF
ncbi:MAG: beta-1,6-N-acetylglucosaminyltransferase [candidate division Zixibacteria bacterium]|nr:beta-1,6-N-acetylglucosaminyltransferase [candidate division Zixibacteria bacterium]